MSAKTLIQFWLMFRHSRGRGLEYRRYIEHLYQYPTSPNEYNFKDSRYSVGFALASLSLWLYAFGNRPQSKTEEARLACILFKFRLKIQVKDAKYKSLIGQTSVGCQSKQSDWSNCTHCEKLFLSVHISGCPPLVLSPSPSQMSKAIMSVDPLSMHPRVPLIHSSGCPAGNRRFPRWVSAAH